MINLKITSSALEGSNIRYWFQILKDGAVHEDGLSYVRTPQQSDDEVKAALSAIKKPYIEAEQIVDQTPDPLIGIEL